MRTILKNWVNCWNAKVILLTMLISSQAVDVNSNGRFRDQESSESGNTPMSAQPLHVQGDNMIRYSKETLRLGINCLDNKCTLVTTEVQEGEVAGDGDVYMEPRQVTTYPQTFRRIPNVTDDMDQIDKYGRSETQFDLQTRQMLRDIKLEMDGALMMSIARASTPGAISSKFSGFWERVVGTNTSALALTDFTMAALRAAVDGISDYYDPSDELNAQLYVPLRQTHIN